MDITTLNNYYALHPVLSLDWREVSTYLKKSRDKRSHLKRELQQIMPTQHQFTRMVERCLNVTLNATDYDAAIGLYEQHKAALPDDYTLQLSEFIKNGHAVDATWKEFMTLNKAIEFVEAVNSRYKFVVDMGLTLTFDVTSGYPTVLTTCEAVHDKGFPELQGLLTILLEGRAPSNTPPNRVVGTDMALTR